jgi:hypothetical protein
MNRLLLLFTFAAFVVVSAFPAMAQQRQIERATVVPQEAYDVRDVRSPVEARVQIDEGVTYGMHNRPGSTDDCYGSFNPEEPFDASCTESYATSAFAGTIGGDDLFYYVLQTDTTTAVDSLYAYDFDAASEVGTPIGISYIDLDGNEIPADSQATVAPQWVDAGIDTETGEMILLGRAGACGAEQGAELWSLNLSTGEANEILRFQDPDNCPLSGAYDNELGVYVGMVPDAGAEGVYQTDLTDGSTMTSIPLPDDLFQGAIAGFIQGGATNFGLDDDPSNNSHWLFLFEGVNPKLSATARQAQFDNDGLLESLVNFGEIDDEFAWVEVLATGFPNQAPIGPSNVEGAAAPEAFEFVGVYPNPFQSAATVMLRTAEPLADVTVRAYDVLGRQVALVHDGPLTASTHQFGLEAARLPAGVYFVTVRSGDFAQTKKVVIVD